MAKQKVKEGMTKYITVGQGCADYVSRHLQEQLGLKVRNLGWTDGSTTTTTLMVRTKKSLDEVQECAWKATAWVDASLTNPMEKPLRMGTWYD
jgi:hypothetical protein